MKTKDATRKDVEEAYISTACTLDSDEAIRGKIADALKLLNYLDLPNNRPDPNIVPFLPSQPRYIEDIIK